MATVPAKVLHLNRGKRSEQSMLADAFEHAPCGMAVIDKTGRITHANSAFAELIGVSRADLFELSFTDISHPDDLETESAQRKRLCDGEIDRYQLAQRLIRKDGFAIWATLAVSAGNKSAAGAEYFVMQAQLADGPAGAVRPVDAEGLAGRVGEAMHEIGNTLTPLMVNTQMIVEQSKHGDVSDAAKAIFNAARRIAFTLRRLRGVDDIQPVAYLGPSRMLDLRTVAPPKETE